MAGRGREQGHCLVSARTRAPVPIRVAQPPGLKDPWAAAAAAAAAAQRGVSALSLWSLSGTTAWGRTLTLDRKEVEAAALRLGLGPRSWFYGSTASLRETINQAANGPPAGGGPWTPRAVGVQPRACLPGDGRGLEGDEGQLEAHPCLRGRGITAQERVPTASPWLPWPAAPRPSGCVLLRAPGHPPHPQHPASSRSPHVAAARRVSRPETFTHTPSGGSQKRGSWGAGGAASWTLSPPSAGLRPCPLALPASAPPQRPGGWTQGLGFAGFCAV